METPTNEPRVVICNKLIDVPPESAIAGSTRGICHKCGAAVWVAPSTRAHIKLNPGVEYRFTCLIPCGLEMIKEEGDGEMKVEEVAGQREELIKTIQRMARPRMN